MGTLLITAGSASRVVPLAASTLVGRSWVCLARLDHPACPLYWLEVRWMGSGWAWRALAAEERTRGAGTRLRGEWRALTSSFGRGARVTLDDACAAELVDDQPPRPFAIDLLTGEPLSEEAFEARAEVRPDGVWPLGDEAWPREPLADGQTFLAPQDEGGLQVLRVHRPEAVCHTAEATIDLQRSGARWLIELAGLTATVIQGAASVEVRGECVRVLAVYARARADGPGDGWLRPADAHRAWRKLGGSRDSPQQRVEWERARLRGRLARQGVASVDRLFELSREGDTIRTRLAVDAELV